MKKHAHNHTNKQKMVNLALQGGGAHGAFTWGVLDKLLEDGRIGIEGICATSAGTMNACCLVNGMHVGGAEKAREILHDFWWKISQAGEKQSLAEYMPWSKLIPASITNPINYFMLDAVSRIFSPYQLNPFDYNPLRDILNQTIDFDELQKCNCVKLFINATNVHNGKVKIFNTNEITLDVAMASACLPFMFKAVNVGGEDYWDGGYVGNPAMFPLFYETDTRDVLIVHINPMERPQTPTTAQEIMNRVNEVSFNTSLLKEIRAIAFVKKLLEHDMLKDEHKADFKDVLIHSIRDDELMCSLSLESKISSDWKFLTMLRDKGRESMEEWINEHFDDIGERDTLDLHNEFLDSNTKIFENASNRNKKIVSPK
jgi:NTE family protein